MKLLPEVYFATMLAGKLSKMHWQGFRMFSHLQHSPKWQYIGHNNNVSRNQEIAAKSVFCNYACRKLIQNASAGFQNVFPPPDCVGHGPKWQYSSHKNNVSRNCQISAWSLFCNNACQKIIQNASAVLWNIFPPPDCIQHGPKWQYIGHINNRSRNRAGQCFRTSSHLRIASGTVQNGNTSATKIMGQEIVKLLPEVYFATMLAGKLSKMHRQGFRMFSPLDCIGHGPKWQYSSHKNNVSRNCQISAWSLFCNNACQKIIQNASAVLWNIFPPPDCIQHGPKWQYIGHINNRSRNRAGSVFNACWNWLPLALPKMPKNQHKIWQRIHSGCCLIYLSV